MEGNPDSTFISIAKKTGNNTQQIGMLGHNLISKRSIEASYGMVLF